MKRNPVRKASTCALLVLAISSIFVLSAPVVLAARDCHYFAFAKGTPNDSTMIWYYKDANGNCSQSISWRTGSGTNTNACDEGDGWLPGGWYDNVWDSSTCAMCHNRNGVFIDGRAWRLSDKQCQGGTTWRDELFIHSEETVTNEQDCPTSSDDPHCWENDNDFYSDGCPKLYYNGSGSTSSSSGIGGAHWSWHNRATSDPGHGSSTERLYVYQP